MKVQPREISVREVAVFKMPVGFDELVNEIGLLVVQSRNNLYIYRQITSNCRRLQNVYL
jgi:hypothetical protein